MHLYLHVPFCKQACHYCDFHFSTNLRGKRQLVEAMAHEIDLRHTYLPKAPLETIYFGGGTPSLLTEAELAHLFEAIHRHFTVAAAAEITLEANPDDLADPTHLAMLRRYVNRLSIGIQTFDEETLRWMNRAHNATEAEICVQRARDAGFDNLSIDLIYGISERTWATDLAKALALNVPHLSAYNLTIEPDTAFGRWAANGKLTPVDENLSAIQFTELDAALNNAGYVHYEISNFARPGHLARHNTAYWQRKPYLGVGPSAHSYNGHSRQYNVPNNALYSKALKDNQIPADYEELTRADQVNEYLLTGLRTSWGCQISELDALLGKSFLIEQQRELAKLVETGWLQTTDNVLLLTETGKLFADRVASDLFVE
ncbi:radical SAM family heme chaperone HemW [Fibrella forsythiae]|uniref:Heme chaperone HemW n=1 Tax=Fibrella forsythiae TaxID=2817061 RepID=A0ABS3JIW4_9BACT|nr:radical SAM family heme chaperone HemW [Fibrella forsythiae]MBO0948812.1 radical SAM family heme chaperone HemW [Fibrella forsythiae]